MLAPNEKGDAKDRGRRVLCDLRDRYGKPVEDFDAAVTHVEVTCRLCLAKMARQAKAQHVATTIAAAVWSSKQAPLTRNDHAILRRSIEGVPEATGPRWFSVSRALEHAGRVLLDGAPVRSSSDPDRYGVLPQRSIGEVPTPAAIAGREDVIAVLLSIDRAADDCAAAVALGRLGVPLDLDADDFRTILWWSTQGERVWTRTHPERKGGHWRFATRSLGDIADVLRAKHRRDVTETQVGIARNAIASAFADRLRGMGELAEKREERASKEKAAWDPARRLREARAANG